MASGRGSKGKLLTFTGKREHTPEPFPLHERLREERQTARLSQAEVARRLGKTPSWVSRVESGYFEAPGRLLPAYAKALGITVSRIFNESFRAAG